MVISSEVNIIFDDIVNTPLLGLYYISYKNICQILY